MIEIGFGAKLWLVCTFYAEENCVENISQTLYIIWNVCSTVPLMRPLNIRLQIHISFRERWKLWLDNYFLLTQLCSTRFTSCQHNQNLYINTIHKWMLSIIFLPSDKGKKIGPNAKIAPLIIILLLGNRMPIYFLVFLFFFFAIFLVRLIKNGWKIMSILYLMQTCQKKCYVN